MVKSSQWWCGPRNRGAVRAIVVRSAQSWCGPRNRGAVLLGRSPRNCPRTPIALDASLRSSLRLYGGAVRAIVVRSSWAVVRASFQAPYLCDSPGLADTGALVLRRYLSDIFSLKFFR